MRNDSNWPVGKCGECWWAKPKGPSRSECRGGLPQVVYMMGIVQHKEGGPTTVSPVIPGADVGVHSFWPSVANDQDGCGCFADRSKPLGRKNSG